MRIYPRLTASFIVGSIVGSTVMLSGCHRHASTPQEGIAALRKAVSGLDAGDREQAIADLQAMGDSAVEEESTLLADDNASVRSAAVDLLAANGRPALLPTLGMIKFRSADTDDAAERIFVKLLPGSVDFLVRELKSTNTTMQLRAAWAISHEPQLAKLGGPGIPALVEMIHDPDIEHRAKAAEAINKIGLATGHVETAALQELLKDPSQDIRLFAAQALGMNQQATIEAAAPSVSNGGLHPYAANPTTLWAPVKRPGLDLREGSDEAAVAETVVDGRRCDDWVYVADWAQKHKDAATLKQATAALGTLGPRVMPLYIAMMQVDSAKKLMTQMGTDAVPGILHELARHDNPDLLKILGDMGQPAADALVEELNSDSLTRRAAVTAFSTDDRLAKMGAAAIPKIEARYDRDQDHYHLEDLEAVVRIGNATGKPDTAFLNKIAQEGTTPAGAQAKRILAGTATN